MYITKKTPTDISDNHADYHYEIWNDDGTPFGGVGNLNGSERDMTSCMTEYAYTLQQELTELKEKTAQ